VKRPVKITPRPPFKMPRPKDVDVPKEDAKVEHYSPLAQYLKLNGISLSSFTRALGVDFKTIQELHSGASVPGLATAYEIERLTKGVVPMEAWLIVPKARASLKRFRERSELKTERELKDMPRAGGFAAPMEKRTANNPLGKGGFKRNKGDDDV
jgi:transcriptional regulator with XRE-family HTH domain